MTAKSSKPAVNRAVMGLAEFIQASPEWLEVVSAQKASKGDERFAEILQRHNELAEIQKLAEGKSPGLDGKTLVELITLRDKLQHHELYLRQQEAWSAFVALLGHINQELSHQLGFDFAATVSPRSGGCCG